MSFDQVFNQPPPLSGSNAFDANPLLGQLTAHFDSTDRQELNLLGQYVRHEDALELARMANQQPPQLDTHDRWGYRSDRIIFHPAYHALMRRSVANGLHCSIWENDAERAGLRHQSRAARFFLTAQLECGHLCSMTMTNASLATMMQSDQLFNLWADKILLRSYDATNRYHGQKKGVTIGMGMTEKQGGSDLGATTSRADALDNGLYRLGGHKWFFSAPMSDAFFILAKVDEGLSCFLVPRVLPDGEANGLHFQRLKDKLGNRSNATAEVEIKSAIGEMVGLPGRGVSTIMDMVTLTRLDCALASAGLMHASLAEAVHHARHRHAFGTELIDQPLMSQVLADMALDTAAATALCFRLAHAFDNAAVRRHDAAYARLMTPVIKYWVCKIAPAMICETMECLGGNGFVEELPIARHYREAPVNAIWEGAGNIMALDLLRALVRSPQLLDLILEDFAAVLGSQGQRALDVINAAFKVAEQDQGAARILIEQLALTAASVELQRVMPGPVAEAFLDTRLAGQWRTSYGMLNVRHPTRQIIEQLHPEV